MPPLQALLALHGFWLLVLLPLAGWAACRWTVARLRLLGVTLVMGGLLGLLILAAWEAAACLALSPEQPRYLLQRILNAVAVRTDLPLLELTLAGIVCCVAGRRRKTCEQIMKEAQQP